MIHNVKLNGTIQAFDFKLGSGILDCNGREIFEGDIVKCWLDESTPTEAMNFIVAFTNGAFVLDGNDQMTIGEIEALDIEVIGHAEVAR